nr:ribonuclease H-like domain-containing protein [Tanacetum cinerariifolium]
MTHPNPQWHVVPTLVLTRSRFVPLTAARPVTTTVLPINVTRLRPAKTGNPQHALKDKGVIDSRCSRHMTGNISYLSDFEEINRGYVSFGGNPKGELKLNLFSVSQMCDKKNSVLFTDTECIVLSSKFKLPDENHVLLRVPRENNMYNVDLKNIVPSGDLTYLFAKATLDESNLWYRRPGHINLKQ